MDIDDSSGASSYLKVSPPFKISIKGDVSIGLIRHTLLAMSTEYTLSDARPSFAPTPSKLTVPLAVPRAHPYTPWDTTAWNSTLTAVGIPQTEWVAFLTGLVRGR